MQPGERIKQLRLHMGLSQNKLARRAKVSQPTVSDYESGKAKEFRAITLMKLAAALGTTPVYLMTGEGARTIEDAATDEETLLEAFRALDETRRFALIAAAQAMRDVKGGESS